MAHGVENRVPFLDRHVIEFARALPAEHLVAALPTGASGTKVVVKELARRSFDEAFVHRRKSAFNLPLAQYFRSRRFVALMEDRLLPGMIVARSRRRRRRSPLVAPRPVGTVYHGRVLDPGGARVVGGTGHRRARTALTLSARYDARFLCSTALNHLLHSYPRAHLHAAARGLMIGTEPVRSRLPIGPRLRESSHVTSPGTPALHLHLDRGMFSQSRTVFGVVADRAVSGRARLTAGPHLRRAWRDLWKVRRLVSTAQRFVRFPQPARNEIPDRAWPHRGADLRRSRRRGGVDAGIHALPHQRLRPRQRDPTRDGAD